MKDKGLDFKIAFEGISFKWVYFFIGWYWVFAFFSEYAFWSSFGISLFDHAGLTEILVKSAESLLKLLLLIFPATLFIFLSSIPRRIFQTSFARFKDADWFDFSLIAIETLSLIGVTHLLAFAANKSLDTSKLFFGVFKSMDALVLLVYVLMAGLSVVCFVLLKKFTSLSVMNRLYLPSIIFLSVFFGVHQQVSDSSKIKSGESIESRHVISCESGYFSCEQKSIYLIGQLSDRWYFWNLESESVFSVRSEALDTISLASSEPAHDKAAD